MDEPRILFSFFWIARTSRAMTEGVKDCPNKYVLSPAQGSGTDGNFDI